MLAGNIVDLGSGYFGTDADTVETLQILEQIVTLSNADNSGPLVISDYKPYLQAYLFNLQHPWVKWALLAGAAGGIYWLVKRKRR